MLTRVPHRSIRQAAMLAAFLFTAAVPLVAQQAAPRVFTADDYARAERFMGYNTNPLVFHAAVRPNWLADSTLLPVAARGAAGADDRFWYRVTVPGGAEFILVDPARATRERAFDHEKLAAALSAAANGRYTALTLPFTDIELSTDGRSVEFVTAKRRWSCDRQGSQCISQGEATGGLRGSSGPPGAGRDAVTSPDGTRAAFVREFNLWVRDVAGNRETQLTTDGIKDFAYATNDAGWTRSDMPVVVWSPDSKRIATFRHDSRGVGEMYLVNTVAGHPTLTTLKYPLPGDDKIFMIERVVIDVDQKKVVKIDLPVDPHRSTLCDHIVCGGTWSDVQWSADSREVAFVSTSRDHKREDMRVADAGTGAVRNILSERAETFFESGQGRVNWRYLPQSKEVLWYSRKDDWGHLYLHDAANGMQKNRITTGDGNVTQVLRVDEAGRTIYFQGVGKESGHDPYFRQFYKIGFDGRNQTLLTPEDADHSVELSPSGRFFVDTYSGRTRPRSPCCATPRGRS